MKQHFFVLQLIHGTSIFLKITHGENALLFSISAKKADSEALPHEWDIAYNSIRVSSSVSCATPHFSTAKKTVYNSAGGVAIEYKRVHQIIPRLNRPGLERPNRAVERIVLSLLARKLIMSATDGLRHFMASCLARGHLLSEQ